MCFSRILELCSPLLCAPIFYLPFVLDTCNPKFSIVSVCCTINSQHLFHHLRVKAEHYQLMRSFSAIRMLFWEDICHLFLVRFWPPLESILSSFVSLCSIVVHQTALILRPKIVSIPFQFCPRSSSRCAPTDYHISLLHKDSLSQCVDFVHKNNQLTMPQTCFSDFAYQWNIYSALEDNRLS